MQSIKGEQFTATFEQVSQDRISSDKVREILPPEDLPKVIQTVSYTQIKSKRFSGDKPAFQMPNLSNATPEGLADMLGEVREQIKDLQKLEGIYKQALEARVRAQEEQSESNEAF